MRKGPPNDARALLRSGIATVDWYEEDYAGALREWQMSYENLGKDDYKAWVLYQIGRCQQRLGMFREADASFRDVEKFYPGSMAAAKSATRIGMNAFYVEVVEFSDLNSAEQTAGKLRKDGHARQPHDRRRQADGADRPVGDVCRRQGRAGAPPQGIPDRSYFAMKAG